MTQRRGADFDVILASTIYAVARINVSADVPPLVTSNTEGRRGNSALANSPGFSSVIPDLPEGTVELVSATFDDAENPFEAPYNITVGEYVSVVALPSGVGGVSYDYGNCLVLHIDHAGSVPGAQPLTIRLKTDGSFKLANS